VLAFGLGHVDGTAPPGGAGLSVVGGHRDGDARFLAGLEPGDVVRLRTAAGVSRWQVRGARVVQAGSTVPDPGPGDRMWLVTCWPIDAVRPGASRYVVELRR
jgi:sortase A